MAKVKQNLIPHKLAHIQTISHREYILIQWRAKGFETERYYGLYLVDVKAGLISSNPILEFVLPYEQRHRYAPYLHGFTPLLIYAISMELFKNHKQKTIRLSIEKLDALFKRFIKDYNEGLYDSYIISAPDVGNVIKGRMK